MSTRAIFLLHIDPIENAKAYSDRYLTTGIKNGAGILSWISRAMDYSFSIETTNGEKIHSKVLTTNVVHSKHLYKDPIFLIDGSLKSKEIGYRIFRSARSIINNGGSAGVTEDLSRNDLRTAFKAIYWMTLFLKQLCYEYSVAYGKIHQLNDYIKDLSLGLLKLILDSPESKNGGVLQDLSYIQEHGFTKEIFEDLIFKSIHIQDSLEVYLDGSKIRYLSSKPSYLARSPLRGDRDLTLGTTLSKLRKRAKVKKVVAEGKLDLIIEKIDRDIYFLLDVPNLQEKVEKVLYHLIKIRMDFLREKGLTGMRYITPLLSLVMFSHEGLFDTEIKKRIKDYMLSLPSEDLLLASIVLHISNTIFYTTYIGQEVSARNPEPAIEPGVLISLSRVIENRENRNLILNTIGIGSNIAVIYATSSDEVIQNSVKDLAVAWIRNVTKTSLRTSLDDRWKHRVRACLDGKDTSKRSIFPLHFDAYIPSEIFFKYLERFQKPRCQTPTSTPTSISLSQTQ